MRIDGAIIHMECDGLGIVKDKDGKDSICNECMGTGMVTAEANI